MLGKQRGLNRDKGNYHFFVVEKGVSAFSVINSRIISFWIFISLKTSKSFVTVQLDEWLNK